ncbi:MULTISPECIES: hypothetical protein [unclassified Bradyrhizobium]|uniref:hypothetical protein n=1 Tax=unclassified Bradyrhizobium TaxID=2631580 RepID=UPI002916C80F|nr:MULTISPECIES: hypothetical protein [unclassified Bradyrhizobium]
MKIGDAVDRFLQALIRTVGGYLSGLTSYEVIELSDALYFRVPKAKLDLRCVGPGGPELIQSMELSIDEAKDIFRAIQLAIDSRECTAVTVGGLKWVTDARSHPQVDQIIMMFDGPIGRTRQLARRGDVVRAIAEFNRRFGPI